MKCPHCDFENEIGTIFCKSCGKDINLSNEMVDVQKMTVKERKESQRNLAIFIIILVVSIIILLIKIT